MMVAHSVAVILGNHLYTQKEWFVPKWIHLVQLQERNLCSLRKKTVWSILIFSFVNQNGVWKERTEQYFNAIVGSNYIRKPVIEVDFKCIKFATFCSRKRGREKMQYDWQIQEKASQSMRGGKYKYEPGSVNHIYAVPIKLVVCLWTCIIRAKSTSVIMCPWSWVGNRISKR